MMSFQRKSNNWRYISILVLLALLVVLHGPIYRLISQITEPVMYISSNFSDVLDDSAFFAKNKSELIEIIKSKEIEIQQLKANQVRFNLIEETNNQLLTQLNMQDFASSTISKSTAYIINRPPSSPYDILSINKGGSDGVKEGDFVTSYGIYIGKIISVKDNVSSVLLTSSPSSELPVFIASSTYMMKGLGGGSMMIEVPKGHGIEVEDPVSLSGVPNLISVGSVKHIESKDQDPFDRIFISLPISLSSMRFVEIHEAPSI